MQYKKILFIFLFAFISLQKLTLVSHEFPLDVQSSGISGWQTSENSLPVVSCRDHKYFGPFKNKPQGSWIRKTYKPLPPHYQVSISANLNLIGHWETDRRIYVKIDDNTIYDGGLAQWQINDLTQSNGKIQTPCAGAAPGNARPDQTVPFPVAFVIDHNSSELKLEFTANNNKSSNESWGIQNLYVYIQECHPSCLKCSGSLDNQCTECPPGSILNQNKCQCQSGKSFDHKCQDNCPGGYILNTDSNSCEIKCSENCQQCDSFSSCQKCENGYKLLNGFCYDRCPFFAPQNGNNCQDSDFNQIQSPYLLYQDLINKEFSSAHIKDAGWSYDKEQSYSQEHNGKKYTYLNYSSSQCENLYLMSGYAGFLTSNCSGCKLQKVFENLPPHHSLNIKFKLYQGDSWDNEYLRIYLSDEKIYDQRFQSIVWKYNEYYCGSNMYGMINSDIKKDIVVKDVKHNNSTLNFGLQWQLSQTSMDEWAGFRELQIILHRCSQQCLQCESFNVCNSCEEGYYLDSTFSCVPCKNGCSGCSSQDECSKCETGYYITQDKKCLQCMHPCTECEDSELNCTVCVSGENRLDITKKCQCASSYFDDGSKCQQCNLIKCSTCTGQADNCILCSDSTRDKDDSCKCKLGYFEQKEANSKCGKCSKQCQTCESESDNCLQCSHETRLNPPVCSCKLTYYDDNISQECIKCSGLCKNCLSPTLCLSCIDPNRLGQNCKCKQGFYETLNKNCEECSVQCKTCNQRSDQCQQCAIGKNRDLNSVECKCFSGFYAIQGKLDCERCPIKCSACTYENNQIQCQQCSNPNYMLPDCEKEKTGNYFALIQDENRYQVKECSKRCEKCETNLDNCLSCRKDKFRNQNPPNCDCLQGYHDFNGKSDMCFKCHAYCKACTSYDKCTSCPKEKGFILDAINQKCICEWGYKVNLQTNQCEKCYQFQGQCLFQCPQNSQKIEKPRQCLEINYSYQDMIFPIIFGFSIISVLTICGIILSKTLNSKNLFKFQTLYNTEGKKEMHNTSSLHSDVLESQIVDIQNQQIEDTNQ